MEKPKKKTSRKRCKKCSYEWNYSGKRDYFCCPNCMSNAKHPSAV